MGGNSDDDDDFKINYDSNTASTSLIEHDGDDWGTIKPKEGENFLANAYWKAPEMFSIDDLLLSEGF